MKFFNLFLVMCPKSHAQLSSAFIFKAVSCQLSSVWWKAKSLYLFNSWVWGPCPAMLKRAQGTTFGARDRSSVDGKAVCKANVEPPAPSLQHKAEG